MLLFGSFFLQHLPLFFFDLLLLLLLLLLAYSFYLLFSVVAGLICGTVGLVEGEGAIGLEFSDDFVGFGDLDPIGWVVEDMEISYIVFNDIVFDLFVVFDVFDHGIEFGMLFMCVFDREEFDLGDVVDGDGFVGWVHIHPQFPIEGVHLQNIQLFDFVPRGGSEGFDSFGFGEQLKEEAEDEEEDHDAGMGGEGLLVGGDVGSDGGEVRVLGVVIFVVGEMVHNVCSFVEGDF